MMIIFSFFFYKFSPAFLSGSLFPTRPSKNRVHKNEEWAFEKKQNCRPYQYSVYKKQDTLVQRWHLLTGDELYSKRHRKHHVFLLQVSKGKVSPFQARLTLSLKFPPLAIGSVALGSDYKKENLNFHSSLVQIQSTLGR